MDRFKIARKEQEPDLEKDQEQIKFWKNTDFYYSGEVINARISRLAEQIGEAPGQSYGPYISSGTVGPTTTVGLYYQTVFKEEL